MEDTERAKSASTVNGKTCIVDPGGALSVLSGSLVVELTLALLVIFLPWAVSSIDIAMLMTTLAALAKFPRLQVTVFPPPDETQDEDEPSAINVAIVAPEPAGSRGSVSVSVTPVAVDGPALLTVILNVTLLHGTLQLARFVCNVIRTSALGVTVVGSLALLLPAFVSPDVETVTLLVALGAALAATLTVNVIALLALAAIGPALVQVTVCPTAEQLHPVPVPETKPRPVGRVSVTVIVAVVAPDPTFCTDIV